MFSPDEEIRSFKRVFYIIVILYDIGIALFSSTLYLYMESLSYSMSDINLYISVFWLVSFFAEIPSGAFADSFGRRNTTILSGVIRGIGLFAISLSAKNDIMLTISAILTALGSSLYSGSMSSWVIDKIKKLNPQYDFNQLFSISQTWGTLFSLMAGYMGAQLIGNINLAYPTIISGIVLILTSFITWKIIDNDRPVVSNINLKQYAEIYNSILKNGFKFLKERKMVFWMILTFTSTAFITTAPFNQWQIYFKKDSLGIISGYLYVFISMAGVMGALAVSKMKVKNNLFSFIFCNVVVGLALSISVVLRNFYLSVAFFFAACVSKYCSTSHKLHLFKLIS